jgi:hypothetical protein
LERHIDAPIAGEYAKHLIGSRQPIKSSAGKPTRLFCSAAMLGTSFYQMLAGAFRKNEQ